MDKGNKPAFPSFKKEGDWVTIQPQGGMTLREYASVMAMQGYCTGPYSDAAGNAHMAVMTADALIAELNKGEKE